MLPVSEETGLCGKRIDRQIRQGAEILDILRNMAEDFEEKAAGYEFEIAGNVLRIWKRLRSFLGSDIRRRRPDLQTTGSGKCSCICRGTIPGTSPSMR